MQRTISTESIILVIVCLADMLSTLACILSGIAVEQNPFMAACIRHSTWTFIGVKLASFVPFVFVIEYYRWQNPIFAKNAARTAIVLYVMIYIILTLGVNFA